MERKGKLTFPDVPSIKIRGTGSGICDRIKDSGACFYAQKWARNGDEKDGQAPNIATNIAPNHAAARASERHPFYSGSIPEQYMLLNNGLSLLFKIRLYRH